MKIKTFLFTLAAFALLATACNNETKKDKSDEDVATVDMHDAQNSLDWEGSYFGVLPCASCPGINTTIKLNEDGTYEKTVEYLESDDTPETTHGKFTWIDGSIISIEENTYLVVENQLFALDTNNKIIEGEMAPNYILHKSDLETEPEVNEGYSHEIYSGNDGKEYTIIFNTNPKTPTALVESGDLKETLTQTEVWAKGAEYANEKIKLRVQDDSAVLTVGNKTVNLTEK